MKKFFLIPAVIALAFISSCTEKEQEIENTLPDEELGSGITEFNATLLTTKTQLGTPTGEEGSREWPNLWSDGDKINVNGVLSEELHTGDGFVGTDHAVFTMASAVSGPYYAAYPASAVSGYSSGSATITVPATQTLVAGSYDPAAYIMLGKSDNASLTFSPMMGLVQLTTTAPAEGTLYIKSIEVEPVGDEKMSGSFTTTSNYAGITGGSTSSITINAPNSTEFGTIFTFAIPAQNYVSGVRFRITANTAADGTGDDKVAVFAKQSAFNVAAGTLYPLTAPAFKESGVSWNNLYAITSSSVVCRWTCSNTANKNLKKKAWTIHVYYDSGCNNEVASYAIPSGIESTWESNRAKDDYITYVIGRLSPGTEYWFVIEDTANGTKSPSRSITTEAFSVVEMPTSDINSIGVVYSENFGEIGWGSTQVRTALGYVPNSTEGRSSFANAYDGTASNFRTSIQENNFNSTDFNDAIDNSRLAGYLANGDNVFIKPGHLKMGWSEGHGYIITPEFPIADGKRAKVKVTVDACRLSEASTETFAVATVHSVNINSTKKHSVSGFSMADVDIPGYYSTLSIPAIQANWTAGVADQNIYLTRGDRIVFGPSNGTSNTAGRCFVRGITVEVTAIEDLPSTDYTIYDYSTLSTFLDAAAANSSVTGRLTSNISLTSEQASDLASKYPVANFSGTLYGEGYTISGLTKPLFDDLAGTVDHLVLNSTLNITTDQADLGILANVVSGTVTNCVSKGSVTFNVSGGVTGEHHIAGMFGQALEGSSITGCTNEASVTNYTSNADGNSNELMVGGVLGTFWGVNFTISDCENTGAVINNGAWNKDVSVGGIIGQAGNSSDKSCNMTVSGCINSGPVTNNGETNDATNSVGGVIGWIRFGTYTDNTNTGAVTNTGNAKQNRVGGLIGYLDKNATFDDNSNSGEVSNTGEATDINYVGGLLGRMQTGNTFLNNSNSGTVSNSGDATNYVYMGGIVGYLDKSNAISDAGSSAKYKLTNSGDIENGGSAKNICIGGLFGRNSSGYFNMTGTGSKYSSNSGNITDNSGPAKSNGGDLSIGGIAGYTTTGIKTQYARNSGHIYVTGDKGNSSLNVGGIGGWISNQSFNFNNCRNTGDITVSCTTTASIWVAGIVGCPMNNSTQHYYWYMNATIDTHAANVGGENYTAGLMGVPQDYKDKNGNIVNPDLFKMTGHKLAGTIWGSKTTTGLFCCTKTNSFSLEIRWGDETHPCTIAPGTVRKDNVNEDTVNDITDVTIGILAGGEGSSYDLTSPIDNGYLVVKNW